MARTRAKHRSIWSGPGGRRRRLPVRLPWRRGQLGRGGVAQGGDGAAWRPTTSSPSPRVSNEDFSELMQAVVAAGRWRRSRCAVWTPQGAEVVALKQMDPPLDLTGREPSAGPLAGDYTTGAWGDESRDYYLSVRVPAGRGRRQDAGSAGDAGDRWRAGGAGAGHGRVDR